MLKAPLAGHILQREIQQCRRCRLDGARIYSQGLLPRGRLSPQVNGNPLFVLDHRPDLGQSKLDIKLGMFLLGKGAPLWSAGDST
jgi:hypothetical protein